ncbi:nitroreductase/quinone reductase family protein [Streptomyces sp. NPDC059957]|uniref:nitroreductase/quinone reductase family protein n=1 Tax=unclassified Streptomyces TaxID=2593676 RepID=UPI0036651F5C
MPGHGSRTRTSPGPSWTRCWPRPCTAPTRGRRSGVLRRTAPARGHLPAVAGGVPYGGSYVLTASNAGAGQHPAWYLNLSADPAVTLQVGAESFPALARPATPAETERLWPVVVAAMPSYAAYRGAAARTSGREVPLVLVTRAVPRTVGRTVG